MLQTRGVRQGRRCAALPVGWQRRPQLERAGPRAEQQVEAFFERAQMRDHGLIFQLHLLQQLRAIRVRPVLHLRAVTDVREPLQHDQVLRTDDERRSTSGRNVERTAAAEGGKVRSSQRDSGVRDVPRARSPAAGGRLG